MKQVSILLILIFSCLLYAGNVKETNTPAVDFNEAEYKIISQIISSLNFDLEKDKENIRKLPLYERFVWDAFIWRFYNGNKRNNDLYFIKLKGIELEDVTSSVHRELLRFFQKSSSSELVLNEYLSMTPPHKYPYSDQDLLWVEDLFLKTSHTPLRDTTFFILLLTDKISSKSDKKILNHLSKKEMDTLISFETKKSNRIRNGSSAKSAVF